MPPVPPAPSPRSTDTLVKALLHDNKSLARENLAGIAAKLLELSQAAKALCGEVLDGDEPSPNEIAAASTMIDTANPRPMPGPYGQPRA